MTKVPKTPTLQVHGIPGDLLGRINAYANLVEEDRDELVIEWLREHVTKLEEKQSELKADRKAAS